MSSVIPSLERPLNAKQAAAYLGLSTRHLYQLARDGVIPGTKRGNRWYFSLRKLSAWAGVGDAR